LRSSAARAAHREALALGSSAPLRPSAARAALDLKSAEDPKPIAPRAALGLDHDENAQPIPGQGSTQHVSSIPLMITIKRPACLPTNSSSYNPLQFPHCCSPWRKAEDRWGGSSASRKISSS